MDKNVILTVASLVLAGNGIGLYLIKRFFDNKDTIKKLLNVNNHQGKELVMLSDMMCALIKLNRTQIYALHEKGVYNGNTKDFNHELDVMEMKLNDYMKSIKDKGLFV